MDLRDSRDKNDDGVCRRYPPSKDIGHIIICATLDLLEKNSPDQSRVGRMYSDDTDSFDGPRTTDLDWCGEYQPKSDP